ncbi:MAG: hypothetical protein ABJF10_20205 [Chthoniobacter sp.]|uniref:hypothetical protein n=1 Tax=Chthoniobacter sp. TaxID=2510640 RepID=UPI0032ACC764
MAATLKQESVVVLGHWNMAILDPAWLVRYGIVSAAVEEVTGQYDPYLKRVTFKIADMSWTVDESRIQIEGSQLQHREIEGLTKLVGILQHTPVRGVGFNFLWECPTGEWPDEQKPSFCAKSLPELKQLGFISAEWGGRKSLSDGTLLTCVVGEREEAKIFISANLHRTTTSCDVLSEALSKWQEYKSETQHTVLKLTGVTLL